MCWISRFWMVSVCLLKIVLPRKRVLHIATPFVLEVAWSASLYFESAFHWCGESQAGLFRARLHWHSILVVLVAWEFQSRPHCFWITCFCQVLAQIASGQGHQLQCRPNRGSFGNDSARHKHLWCSIVVVQQKTSHGCQWISCLSWRHTSDSRAFAATTGVPDSKS